ncbi:T-box transcription factor TBX22, partial [Periophthalmus magnuspinnatus]|uniref:T-box transcription factor TBX22 n=1 Tax=Periophthalmus magnuspinnatus TaxID=409849 RepID=UPI002436738A
SVRERMQGLSSRAHAFSVEALMGKPCKRIKLDEHDSSSTEDTGSDTSLLSTGENNNKDSILASPAARCRSEDTCCDPERAAVRHEPGAEVERVADTEVRVELQGSELWRRFYEIGTEMIITKAGRRMFPSVRVKVRNLDPCHQYYVAMDVMPVDSKRYRYVYHSSQWMVAGNTDHSCISPRLYVHPDSPCAGETWMRQVISFDRVKLTNNEMDDKGHIILQSMHKYKPRVHIIRQDPRVDLSQIQSVPAEGVRSFCFPETEFTTVTAYQNQQITKLKIDRNPFAKGFRDPGRNRGVLDGLLESYPWRGPLSLDLKPFSMTLQGSPGSSSSSLSPLKSLLPFSSSSPLHPFSLTALSCRDTPLQTVALPLYPSKSSPGGALCSPSSPMPLRGFSNLGPDRLLPPLPTLSDLPLLSALQGKKSRDLSAPYLIPLSNHFTSQSSSLHLTDTLGPYCLYRYSFPISPPLPPVSRQKLEEDATNNLSKWPPPSNHCL